MTTPGAAGAPIPGPNASHRGGDPPPGELLIVDDEESVLITLQAILEIEGHRTWACGTAAEALAALSRRSFDTVVSDLHLDEGDGLQVIAEAKRCSPTTTGIILTGYASLEAVVSALRSGVDDFLVKPTDVEQLKRAVARCVRKAQEAREVAEKARALEDARRAEAAARDSEARFRLLADAAPVMIWAAGPDKGCTFFNRQWLEFTGRRMEQELGSGWMEGLHPDDLRACLDVIDDAFDAREAFQLECRMRRADGEYRWLSDRGVPFYAPDGAFAGYIGVCSDVTERRREELEREAQLQLERSARFVAQAEAEAARAEAEAALRSSARTPSGPPAPQPAKPARQAPPKPPTSAVGLTPKKPRTTPTWRKPPSSVRGPSD